jgi:predicted ATPase with chaperone activity
VTRIDVCQQVFVIDASAWRMMHVVSFGKNTSQIKGLKPVKRALEVAAASVDNLLML